jgi:DDE superfamily endonuclease
MEQCADGFPSPESFARGRRHCLSHLAGFGRHTITGLLRNQNRTQQDWTADYRFYAQGRLDVQKIFNHLRAEVQQCGGQDSPLVVAMDDSLLRKTGRCIFGCGYRRDPLSPPFQVNFVRGLRVLQISAALRQGFQGAARMIPIDFQHAALPAKPHKNAPQQEQEAYKAQRAARNINRVGRERLARLRQQMDEDGDASRRLIATVDGRFTNSTVLRQIPERTVLIGRVRKDSVFFHPPEQQPERGRKRKYGLRCPTPEALLKDTLVPWQKVQAYAAGQTYEFKLKTLGPVYSAMDKGHKALRLVVIEPVPYRPSKKSKLQRREPAFLICTDPQMPLPELLQTYLWRWDIEVNFRDEKTILGVGQAQVRSEASNQNAPALAVAAYAMLLLASVKTYGAQGKPDTFRSPLWYQRKPEKRATTNELINQLRFELWCHSLNTHFTPFSHKIDHDQNGIKCDHPLESAVFLSIK